MPRWWGVHARRDFDTGGKPVLISCTCPTWGRLWPIRIRTKLTLINTRQLYPALTTVVQAHGVSVPELHCRRARRPATHMARNLPSVANRLASALKRRGIRLGDTVAVMAPNIPELLEAHFGIP